MQDSEIPEITEVQRLRLEPGDKLVVRVDSNPSSQQAAQVQEVVRAMLGLADSFPVLVMPRGASLEVVTSP